MKNSDLDYSFQYANWHSDTLESRQRDIADAKRQFDAHGIFPSEKNAKILEIGCAMGRTMLMLQENGYENLTGIDIDKTLIAIAKKEKLNVVLADALEFLESADGGFDVIYAFDILEHIDKEKQVPLLKAMFSATTDNGMVVFSVPNGLSPTAGFYRYIDFTHTVSYTDNTMRFLLQNAGFNYISVRPQHQESNEVQKLKLPWARLYRIEFRLSDFILTPNLIAIAFKLQSSLDKYLKNAPVIQNDYTDNIAQKPCALKRLWRHIKSGKF